MGTRLSGRVAARGRQGNSVTSQTFAALGYLPPVERKRARTGQWRGSRQASFICKARGSTTHRHEFRCSTTSASWPSRSLQCEGWAGCLSTRRVGRIKVRVELLAHPQTPERLSIFCNCAHHPEWTSSIVLALLAYKPKHFRNLVIYFTLVERWSLRGNVSIGHRLTENQVLDEPVEDLAYLAYRARVCVLGRSWP